MHAWVTFVSPDQDADYSSGETSMLTTLPEVAHFILIRGTNVYSMEIIRHTNLARDCWNSCQPNTYAEKIQHCAGSYTQVKIRRLKYFRVVPMSTPFRTGVYPNQKRTIVPVEYMKMYPSHV